MFFDHQIFLGEGSLKFWTGIITVGLLLIIAQNFTPTDQQS